MLDCRLNAKKRIENLHVEEPHAKPRAEKLQAKEPHAGKQMTVVKQQLNEPLELPYFFLNT